LHTWLRVGSCSGVESEDQRAEPAVLRALRGTGMCFAKPKCAQTIGKRWVRRFVVRLSICRDLPFAASPPARRSGCGPHCRTRTCAWHLLLTRAFCTWTISILHLLTNHFRRAYRDVFARNLMHTNARTHARARTRTRRHHTRTRPVAVSQRAAAAARPLCRPVRVCVCLLVWCVCLWRTCASASAAARSGVLGGGGALARAQLQAHAYYHT
jgi:hypothetical protein